MTGEVFRSLDIFGENLPTFILKGKDKVQTRAGGVVTIIIFIVILMFAGYKFIHLKEKRDPVMSQYYKENYYTNG